MRYLLVCVRVSLSLSPPSSSAVYDGGSHVYPICTRRSLSPARLLHRLHAPRVCTVCFALRARRGYIYIYIPSLFACERVFVRYKYTRVCVYGCIYIVSLYLGLHSPEPDALGLEPRSRPQATQKCWDCKACGHFSCAPRHTVCIPGGSGGGGSSSRRRRRRGEESTRAAYPVAASWQVECPSCARVLSLSLSHVLSYLPLVRALSHSLSPFSLSLFLARSRGHPRIIGDACARGHKEHRGREEVMRRRRRWMLRTYRGGGETKTSRRCINTYTHACTHACASEACIYMYVRRTHVCERAREGRGLITRALS